MWEVLVRVYDICAVEPKVFVVGALLGAFVMFVLLRLTGTSPVWALFGKWVMARMQATGVVTKGEVRDSDLGAAPVLNSFLDRIEPKEVRRARVRDRIAEGAAELVPGGGFVVRGIGALLKRRRERKQ